MQKAKNKGSFFPFPPHLRVICFYFSLFLPILRIKLMSGSFLSFSLVTFVCMTACSGPNIYETQEAIANNNFYRCSVMKAILHAKTAQRVKEIAWDMIRSSSSNSRNHRQFSLLLRRARPDIRALLTCTACPGRTCPLGHTFRLFRLLEARLHPLAIRTNTSRTHHKSIPR